MRAKESYILAPPSLKVEIRLEPALSNFESLSLMSSMDYLSGLNQWIVETAAALSPEDRHRNEMLFMGFWAGLRPTKSYPDFESYLNDLRRRDPQAMVDENLEWMLKEEPIKPDMDAQTLMSDLSVYLQCVEDHYTAHKAEKGVSFDADLYTDIYTLLKDPPTAKEVFIAHLRKMWETILKPEWEHHLPMLRQCVEAFQQIDYSGLTPLEAIREITGRDLSSTHWENWEERLIFVPSPHLAPYVARYEQPADKLDWILFGARLPEGTKVYAPAFSRSELNTRLSALADDTRLRILELLTQHEELCAQDIMVMLDLSQSAASRHLRQLTANGYLVERRQENAKCYSLNRERFENVIDNLRRFVRLK